MATKKNCSPHFASPVDFRQIFSTPAPISPCLNIIQSDYITMAISLPICDRWWVGFVSLRLGKSAGGWVGKNFDSKFQHDIYAQTSLNL